MTSRKSDLWLVVIGLLIITLVAFGGPVLLARVAWIAKETIPDWRWWLGLAAVGVVVSISLITRCYCRKPVKERLAAATLAQAIFLALAFGAAVFYGLCAYRQVEATKEQLDATYLLAGRASLFVSDPIHTVRDFAGLYLMPAAECELTEGVSEWLMIEISNEGQGPAINVDVCANWVQPGYDKGTEVLPSANMASPKALEWLLAHICSDHRQYQVWRHWRLLPGESRFLYFRCPPYPYEATESEHRLRVRWYDPNGEGWEWEPKVFYRPADKTWYTGWGGMIKRRNDPAQNTRADPKEQAKG